MFQQTKLHLLIFALISCIVINTSPVFASDSDGADTDSDNTQSQIAPSDTDEASLSVPTHAALMEATGNQLNAGILAVNTCEEYANAVLNDSPVAYWRLNETSGIAVTNLGTIGSAVNGYYLSPTLGVTGLAVASDYAADFSGDDYISIPSHSSINTSNITSRTIELWFSADQLSGKQVLYEEGGVGNGLNLYLNDNLLTLGVWANDSGTWITATVATATIHHVALVYDASATAENRLQGYLDGDSSLFSSLSTDITLIPAHASSIGIGQRHTHTRYSNSESALGDGDAFNGIIDEVALYNTPLSAEQIATHFVACPPDLTIAKSVEVTDLAAGVAVTYTLTFSNTGSRSRAGVNFTNIVITDIVPSEVTDLSVSSSGVAVTDTGAATNYVWSVDESLIDTVGSITISGQISDDGIVGDVINNASISATGDSDDSNNSASATLTLCNDTITVQNANDSGAGSLRQAIADLCTGGTINFAGDTTLYLDSELTLDKAMTIDGSAYLITLSGDSGNDGSANVRIFSVQSGAVVVLDSLSIVSGTATIGGGILNQGQLTVQNSTLYSNTSTVDSVNTGGGGAIMNQGGQLTVIDSTINENYAVRGGAIFIDSSGVVTLTYTTISSNTASKYAGGIYNYGVMTIEDSTISANTATTSGGGMYTRDLLSASRNTFANNQASYGAAIYADSDRTTISDSTFAENQASTNGGAIFNNDTATLTVTSSSFVENQSTQYGGAIFNESEDGFDGVLLVSNSTFSDNRAYSGGGAILSEATSTISDSTFSNNIVYNNSTIGTGAAFQHNGGNNTLTNCSMSGNQAQGTGDDGGGAIMVYDAGALTVTHCTLVDNSSATYGGGIAIARDSSATVTLQNNVIASNSSISGGMEISGSVTSLGYNLIGEGGGATGITDGVNNDLAGDASNPLDPQLDLLADNGGETLTHLPLSGSLLIDRIPSGVNDCGGSITTDQRGMARPIDDFCDIGAVELDTDFVPQAVSESYTTNEDLALIESAPGLLANDSDGDFDTLIAVLSTAPEHGELQLASDGSFIYTPTADFNGSDSFVYQARDDDSVEYSFSDPATVILTVTPVNDAPVAVDDSAATVAGSAITIDVRGNDLDVDNDELAVVGVTAPLSGTATIDGTSIVYTPTDGFVGEDSFEYAVSDGVLEDSASVVVVVCSNAITVSNANDSGSGSLRQAINDACDGGTIDFDSDYTVYLDSTLSLNKSVTIDGSNHAITVSGDSGNDGSRNVQVFLIESSGVVTLSSLKIVSGTTSHGGGIYNYGTLTLNNSTLSDNRATDGNGRGAGIYNNGVLTVNQSSFSANSSLHIGGGIYNNSSRTLTINNSTFANNSANYGGAISNQGTLTIAASTFSGNSAGSTGGALYSLNGTVTAANSTFSASTGSEILNQSTLYLRNNILANTISGVSCVNNGTLAANVNNLIEDGSCSATFTGDPNLAPLSDYGGDTQTFALLPGSLALDAGDATTCETTDQRGESRYGTCDIGAFESQGFVLAISGGNNQSTEISSGFATPLQVQVSANNASEPVGADGQLTFSAPSSGASLSSPTLTSTTSSGGAVSLAVTANALAGSYSVTVSAKGVNTPVSFALTNSSPATATPTNTPTATNTATNTPIPPTSTATATSTATNTPVSPTQTATQTPIPPTSTATATNTATNTPVSPTNTATQTPIPLTSTATATNTATNTPVSPTNTATQTPIPPTSTATATSTATNTPVSPTNTATQTPIPLTGTATATNTATNTPVSPTNTATQTLIPPTSTATATSTPTNTVVIATATPVSTITTTPIALPIQMEFRKTVSFASLAAQCTIVAELRAPVGSAVRYCYTLINRGQQTVKLGTLVDSHLGMLLASPDVALSPGQIYSHTVVAQLTVSTTNIATWTVSLPSISAGLNGGVDPNDITTAAQATVIISAATDDLDQDGIPDNDEGADDLDGDDKPNFLDDDSDGDGAGDQSEGTADRNNDGTPDFLDPMQVGGDSGGRVYLPLVTR